MRFLTSLTLLLSTTALFAQHTNFNTQRNWSLNKKEIIFGLGATQFLGDLGGRDMVGKDFSPVDMDLASTGMGGMIGYRFRFHPFWATSSTINIGMVRGNDAHTNEIIRNSRNLHFRSMIYEFQQRIECIIIANEKFGARYNISGHSKRMKNRNEQVYLFTGVGVSYFNPKAQYNGSWVALRPLSTEGQGLDGGPSKTAPVTATIPFGIGIRGGIGRMWRIGVEATYVKTFSDYIDDVHGEYYDPAILAAQVGADAAYLSNPAKANTNWFAPGQQRGDEQMDAYFYLNVVVARNLTYKDYSRQRRMNKWKGRYKF